VKGLNEDLKNVFAEAKSNGYCPSNDEALYRACEARDARSAKRTTRSSRRIARRSALASRAPRAHASAPAPARARKRYLERKPAKPRAKRAGDWRLKKHDDLIVSLGPDEGFLNWTSSPHVMFLACCHAGVKFEIPPE
jgi:hypothetical protein